MMVFVATKNWLYLLLGTAGGAAAAVVAYQLFPMSGSVLRHGGIRGV